MSASSLIQIETPAERAARGQAFRESRRAGIGGSDIHHVFSLEPYGCARKLYYEKLGVEPDYASKNEDLFERGHELEPVIVAKYLRETGRRGEAAHDTYSHRKFEVLRVNLDYVVYRNFAPDSGGVELQSGVLECKSANREVFGKMKKEGLPRGYLLQLQHAMHVTGAKWGAFAVLWPDGWKMIYFDVDYDAELAGLIEAESLRFWDRVVTQDPPDRLKASDKRCKSCEFRTSCQGAAMLEGIEDGCNDDVPRVDIDLGEYFELKELADQADGLLEIEKERIKDLMEKYAAADAVGARIYYRAHERASYDAKRLAAKYEELRKELEELRGGYPEGAFPPAAAFLQKSIVRPLRVYPR